MAGYRSRSPSRSYSPRRRYSRSLPRRKRYDDPRDRYRGGGGGGGGARRLHGRPSAQSGLLIRNISLTARPEDIRVPFEQFGPVKDVYLPRNFHTRGRDHRDKYSRHESYSLCPQDNRHYRSDSRSPSQDGGKPPVSPVTKGHGPPVVSSP
ncbi:unnamed protein product [Urochloa humidicola]